MLSRGKRLHTSAAGNTQCTPGHLDTRIKSILLCHKGTLLAYLHLSVYQQPLRMIWCFVGFVFFKGKTGFKNGKLRAEDDEYFRCKHTARPVSHTGLLYLLFESILVFSVLLRDDEIAAANQTAVHAFW